MLTSLLYVSRSMLDLPRQAAEVDAIVAASLPRNQRLDVTGALVFTERHFAQYFEGPRASIDELMASIRRDPRHCEVQVVLDREVPARRFGAWAMAYAGPSTFVAGNVLPLTDMLPPAQQLKAAERLIELMRQFVDAHLAARRREGGTA
jgi:phytoene dehydrogenase-like protein